MLVRIRTDINKDGHCMLRDGFNMLSLCIVPYYEEKLDEIESIGELAHKAPVVLDCFFEKYAFHSWDLTTQKVGIQFLTHILLHVIICINSLPVYWLPVELNNGDFVKLVSVLKLLFRYLHKNNKTKSDRAFYQRLPSH
jgi:hypothetical protein